VIALSLAMLSLQAAAYPGQCQRAPQGWVEQTDDTRSRVVVNHVNLYSDGALHWNGSDIDRAQLAQFVHVISVMRPVPLLILTVEHGAPCDDVVAIRSLMFDQGDCANNHVCVNGGGVAKFDPEAERSFVPAPPAPPRRQR